MDGVGLGMFSLFCVKNELHWGCCITWTHYLDRVYGSFFPLSLFWLFLFRPDRTLYFVCGLAYSLLFSSSTGLHSLTERSRNRQERHALFVLLVRFCYRLAGSGLHQISCHIRRSLWFPRGLGMTVLTVVESVRVGPAHSRMVCWTASLCSFVASGPFRSLCCPCPVSCTVSDRLSRWCVSWNGERVLHIRIWQNP